MSSNKISINYLDLPSAETKDPQLSGILRLCVLLWARLVKTGILQDNRLQWAQGGLGWEESSGKTLGIFNAQYLLLEPSLWSMCMKIWITRDPGSYKWTWEKTRRWPWPVLRSAAKCWQGRKAGGERTKTWAGAIIMQISHLLVLHMNQPEFIPWYCIWSPECYQAWSLSPE